MPENEQVAAMAPPYAGSATGRFAVSATRRRAGERCHLHPVLWGWHGLTDIHHKARSAGEDAHHGD